MKRPTKNSGVPWLGDVPAKWEMTRCKYVFETYKTIVGDRHPEFERLALTMGGVIKRSKQDSDGLQPEDFSHYQVLEKDDLVFKLIDLQNISTSRVGLSPFTGIVSPAYIALKLKENGVDIHYAYYFFDMLWLCQIFNQLGNGGVRNSLTPSILLNLPFLIPPLPEQRRIAAFLDGAVEKIDGIRAGIQREIERLGDYKKSLVAETVCRGVRGTNRALKPSGIPWLGDMPAEWEKVRVGRILTEINRRSEVGTEEPLSMSQKYGIVPSKMIDVANPASSFVGAKMVSPGDIVLNKLKAHLGVFAISKYEGLVSPDYAVYRANEGVSAEYFNYVFHSPRCISEFRRRITGVAVGFNRLYTSDLFKIDVPLPSLPEQREIVAYLDKATAQIDAAVEARKGQLEKLDILKKTTIAEFTTGKKEVLA